MQFTFENGSQESIYLTRYKIELGDRIYIQEFTGKSGNEKIEIVGGDLQLRKQIEKYSISSLPQKSVNC